MRGESAVLRESLAAVADHGKDIVSEEQAVSGDHLDCHVIP